MTPQFEMVKTADGSISCIERETGQLCHNSAGAYTEALTHYVQPSGLVERLRRQGQIRVLDACYGLGYNTWALINQIAEQHAQWQASDDFDSDNAPKSFTVQVLAVERFPEVLGFLPHVLAHPTFNALKNKIPPSEHNVYYRTLECFYDTKGGADEVRFFTINLVNGLRIELELWVSDLRDRILKIESGFDAIFHDPFSPQKMPELWTLDLFRAYYGLLEAREGLLLTYSAAAAVRGGLREAGFSVSKTKPLGVKGGGTMARIAGAAIWKDDGSLPLEAWELEYLESKAGLPYRDHLLCQERADILAQREREQAESLRLSGSSTLKKRSRKTPMP